MMDNIDGVLNTVLKQELSRMCLYLKALGIDTSPDNFFVSEYALCYNKHILNSTKSSNEHTTIIRRVLRKERLAPSTHIHTTWTRRLFDSLHSEGTMDDRLYD